MAAASAPGKVILFGEHAVVSGTPALGSAVDLRATAEVVEAPGSLLVEVSDLNLTVERFSVDLLTGDIKSSFAADALRSTRYVSAVLREFDARNLKVKISSQIPPGSGLGSSAAITVATLAALSKHLGLDMSRWDLAKSSHRIEKEMQKGLGSPMDTALSSFGGYQLVSRQVESVNLPPIDLVVGYTRIPHDTWSEVQKVQSLHSAHPEVVDSIYQAIGALSKKAVVLLGEEKLPELGALMNVNHGLLDALGVNTRELSELVYAARGAGGVLGAKLTGAGGGGCIVALPGDRGIEAVVTAIRQAKGIAFRVRTGCEGVRLEPCSRS